MLNREKVIKIDLMKLIILKVKKSSLPSSIFSFKDDHSIILMNRGWILKYLWDIFDISIPLLENK